MRLKEFKTRVNKHQTHLEDLVLLGEDGLNELNDKIEKFIDKLENDSAELNISAKWDGSPAITLLSKVEGYPENSIGLKSLVSNPANAISSQVDIDDKYGERPDMADKLRYALELAPSIPAGEIWQGDCLFTELNEVEIKGKKYLTFHPNKIVYAISEDNTSYEQIKNADFGICLHTIYKDGKQSFNVDLNRLSNVPSNIYVMSPAMEVNKDSFDTEEIRKDFEELKTLEDKLISNPDYETLCDNSYFMAYWNTFENANLSDKQATKLNVNTFYNDLVDYIKAKQETEYNKKMSTLKTDKGKQAATEKYNLSLQEMSEVLESNKQLLVDIVNCLNKAVDVKMAMWEGLRQTNKGYDAFYKHREQGYIPADMEGISLSDQDGNIVKIVDRSHFSNVNRDPNYMSGFKHESLEEAMPNKDVITIRVYVEPDLEEALPSGNIEDVYDEQTLEEWYDFASTIEGIIERHGDTINIQVSKRPDSLSEYIDFYTINSAGERQPGLIDLRLSDRYTNNARITVNDRTFKSYDEAIQYIRNMFNMRYDESLEDSNILNTLENADAIYIVDDARDYHFMTDEVITEDNDDIDQYPEERLLYLSDNELRNLDTNILHKVTNTELLDRLCSIDRNLLTTEQKNKLIGIYKQTTSIASPQMVEAVLKGLKNCSLVFVEPTEKNLKFRKEFKLTSDDYLDILSQLKSTDYVNSKRSFNVNHLGNNLLVFEPQDIEVKGQKLDLTLYIKIDLNESNNICIYAVSVHKSGDVNEDSSFGDIDD